MYKKYNFGYGVNVYCKPWNGTTAASPHRYPIETSAHELLTDKDGNIYYIDGRGKLSPWCSFSRLGAHLNRLHQLGVIKEANP